MAKRILLFLTAAALLLSLFTACGQAAGSAQSSAESVSSKAEESVSSEQEETPQETAVLSLVTSDQGLVENGWSDETPNLILMNEIFEERFGARITVEPMLADRMEELLGTRIAAQDLPDIINYRFSDNRLVELYSNGIIIAQNDLIAEHAPNISAWFEEAPYLMLSNSDSNGNVLRIPYLVQNPSHQMACGIIRNDWLEAVGMDVPETADELYDALVAFRAQDVNGNGSADEVAISMGIAQFNRVISSGFGVPFMSDATNSFYMDENDKVYHTMLTEEAREYYAYTAKLYAEGLFDASSFNITADQYNEKLYGNKIGFRAAGWWDSVLSNISMNSNGVTGEFIPMKPLIASDGSQFTVMMQLGGYGGFMITRDCEHPEKAAQIFDWGVTEEGGNISYYGTSEENEFFKKPDAESLEPFLAVNSSFQYPGYAFMSKPALTEKVADRPMYWEEQGWKHGFVPQKLVADWGICVFNCAKSWDSAITGLASDIERNTDVMLTYMDNINNTQLLTTMPTDAETDQLSGYSDLLAFIDETTQKFMSGTLSTETDWDSFLAQCEEMGMSELTAIKQAQYDRYLAIG